MPKLVLGWRISQGLGSGRESIAERSVSVSLNGLLELVCLLRELLEVYA